MEKLHLIALCTGLVVVSVKTPRTILEKIDNGFEIWEMQSLAHFRSTILGKSLYFAFNTTRKPHGDVIGR